LNMPAQSLKADAQVEADRDKTAFMRGPIVYCFEGADNGGAVQNLAIPPETKFTPEYQADLLGGVMVLKATAPAIFKTAAGQVAPVPFQISAIPYYANANRGTCQMEVWIPERQERSTPENQE
jgi:uncharacterized protein